MDIVNKNQLQWEYYLRLKDNVGHEIERESFLDCCIIPLKHLKQLYSNTAIQKN